MSNQYKEEMNRIRKYLPEYLREQGIDTTKHFKCLNPAHDDENPSMSLHKGGEFAYCFSRGCSVDIFKAANYLEGKPDKEGFIKENVAYLADKYNIPFQLETMSEQDLYKFNCYRAYRAASNYIVGFWDTYDPDVDTQVTEALLYRSWTPELARKFDIGFIRDFKSFRAVLKQTGFSAKFLDDIDLGMANLNDPSPLFGRGLDCMIFTINNDRAEPCGFIGRNLAFSKDKKNGPKFYNTKSKCPIFQKGDTLYNIHKVKNKYDSIYIVEGPADVITMHQHGVSNAAAVLSTAFRKAHVDLLRKYNIHEIILAMDADEPGQRSIEKMIDNTLAGCYDLVPKVLMYDDDNADPDMYIRKYGVDKFRALEVEDAFKWTLDRMGQYNSDRPESLDSLLKLVVNEPRWMRRYTMCQHLAAHTGIEVSFIENEVKALSDAEHMKLEGRRNEIIRQMTDDIQRNPSGAEHILESAKDELGVLMETVSNSNPLDPKVLIEEIREIKKYNEDKGSELPGLKLGWPVFTENIGGLPFKESLVVIGGEPNSGKSSLMAQMAYDLIINNPDIYVIMHTTDDTTSQFLPRLVSLDQLGKGLDLRGINSPYYKYKDDEEKLAAVDDGYRNMYELIKQERFLIKDSSARPDADTIGYGAFLCRKAREAWPERTIVYMLDNFHKCKDFANKDERIRFKNMSHLIKTHVCQGYGVSGVTTMEYNKGKELNNDRLSESKAMSYDLNLLIHLVNEMNDKAGNTNMVWNDSVLMEDVFDSSGNCRSIPRRKPIVKGVCGKTKLSEWKDQVYWKFDPDVNYFQEISKTEVGRLIKSAEQWQTQELEDLI